MVKEYIPGNSHIESPGIAIMYVIYIIRFKTMKLYLNDQFGGVDRAQGKWKCPGPVNVSDPLIEASQSQGVHGKSKNNCEYVFEERHWSELVRYFIGRSKKVVL